MTRWQRVVHEGQPLFVEAPSDEQAPELAVIAGAPWQDARPTGQRIASASALRLAPALPTKIVCVGRNYKKHAAELGNEVPAEPLLFLKPPSSLIGPGGTIVCPPESNLVHHEGELAVVLGRRLSRADETAAHNAIFGFACANDVTARDIQRREGKFTRAKGFDTFCPLGPELVSADEVPDPQGLGLEVRVDGALRQHGRTADMVFSVTALLAFISHVMTLEAGDVVLTGTPDGVGPLLPDQSVEVSIQCVGTLRNPVAAAGRWPSSA